MFVATVLRARTQLARMHGVHRDRSALAPGRARGRRGRDAPRAVQAAAPEPQRGGERDPVDPQRSRSACRAPCGSLRDLPVHLLVRRRRAYARRMKAAAALALGVVWGLAAPVRAEAPPRNLDELRARISGVLLRERVPGVGIALVEGDRVVWAGGVG